MPDGWEATYGLILLSDDSAADPDGDGRTNFEEYLDGTDPTVADALVPTNLVAGTQTDSTIELTWTAIPPVGGTGSYEIYFATHINGPYTFVGTTADETVESFTITGLMPFTLYYFKLRTVLPGPLYSDDTPVVSQGTLSSSPAPTPYAPSQLAGTWRMHNLRSGDAPQVTGWMHGSLVLDAAGNGTYSTIDSDGFADSGAVQMNLTEHGLFFEAIPALNIHGAVSSDRQLIVSTQNNGSGGYELSVFVKQDPAVTYAPADMAGTWYVHQLVSGDFSAVPSQWTGWTHSTVTIDATGAYTLTNGVEPAGPFPDSSGSFTITADGVMSEVGYLSFHGVMNAAKNLVVFTEE
jgi:hypothetical protein